MNKFQAAALKKEYKKLQKQQQQQQPTPNQEVLIVAKVENIKADLNDYADDIPFEEVEYLEVPNILVEDTSQQPQHSEDAHDSNDIEYEIIQECESMNDYDDEIPISGILSTKNQASNIDYDNSMVDDNEAGQNFGEDCCGSQKGTSRRGGKIKPLTYRSRSNVNVIVNHTCESCGAGFTHVSNLRKHIDTSHVGTLHCESCVKFFDK